MKTCGITPHYELARNNTWGVILSDHAMCTPITGHTAVFNNREFHCSLTDDGELIIYEGSVWDFASGPALNTPAMVAASLMHDAFCHMTNNGKLPWSCRAQADGYFAQMIRDHGPRGGLLGWRTGLTYLSSGWRWLAVSANSQLIARWSRTKA